MAEKDPLQELLEQRKAAQDAVDKIDWEKKKTDWIEDLNALYGQFRGWIAPLVDGDLLTVEEKTVRLQEEYMGTYDAPCLILRDPQRRAIAITPKGRQVIGAIGRVDITAGPRSVMMIRAKEGHWEFASRQAGRIDRHEVTKETFSEVLRELLS